MRFLDYSALLTGPAAELALFSTYEFDPDFFERRLLRCEGLAGARRIVILMDGGKWAELLSREAPTRWRNRRYLVAPVLRTVGVFHPKLSLLLSESGGRVLCGSNNLTRSGCSNNLELLNAVPFELSDPESEGSWLAREAFAFFAQATEEVAPPVRRILKLWLEEAVRAHRWLGTPPKSSKTPRIRLVHSYRASVWDQLQAELRVKSPRAFFIMAPFHDPRAEPCRRLARSWPKAKVELVVQQGYTNLQPASLRGLPAVQLSEVVSSSRRLHAKLLAWKDATSWHCLVGSANFTGAALDGANAEACLLISGMEDPGEALFDSQLRKRRIALEDFEPGPAEEPSSEPSDSSPLRIEAAVLSPDNGLEVSYSHTLGRALAELRLEVRGPAEPRPRASIPLRLAPRASERVALPDHCVTDLHGAMLANLSATTKEEILRSSAIWIVQERHLTHEPGGASVDTQNRPLMDTSKPAIS
ncbi:MAG: hypothetical protein K8F56_18875 [Rhodocyclaceae bacterium]|nr:hypothetical protein [Rhodocyclaceae bacterium]